MDLRLKDYKAQEPSREHKDGEEVRGVEFEPVRGVKVRYEAKRNEVKETIELLEPGPEEFRYKINSPKLKPRQEGETIAFDSDRFIGLFRVHGLRVWDAAGKEIPSSLSLDRNEIVLNLDPEAMTSAKFPVTIDPMISGQLGHAPHARRLFETSDGKLVLFHLVSVSSSWSIAYSVSSDRGESWGEPILIGTVPGVFGVAAEKGPDDSFYITYPGGPEGSAFVAFRAITRLANGSWSVGPEKTVGTGDVMLLPRPSIADLGPSGTGRKLAIGFVRKNILGGDEYAVSLSENSGESWFTPLKCDDTSGGTLAAQGSRLFCIVPGEAWRDLEVREWLGLSWGLPTTIPVGYICWGMPSTVTTDDGRLHLVVAYEGIDCSVRYVSLPLGSNQWTAPVSIGQGSGPVISTTGTSLQVFADVRLTWEENKIHSYVARDGVTWSEGPSFAGQPFAHVLDVNETWAFTDTFDRGDALFSLTDSQGEWGNRIGTASTLHRLDDLNKQISMSFVQLDLGTASSITVWVTANNSPKYRVGLQSDCSAVNPACQGSPSGSWLQDLTLTGSWGDVAPSNAGAPTSVAVTLGQSADLIPGVRYHVVVKPVEDPSGLNNPSTYRWMAVQTVGADTGAEGSMRVLSNNGAGWSAVEGDVPRVLVGSATGTLFLQDQQPADGLAVQKYLLPGESFVSPRNLAPTLLKVHLSKVGQPSSPVTIRLLSSSGGEIWSGATNPAAEGWVSLPVSGVTLTAGTSYRLVVDSPEGGVWNNHWRLNASNGQFSSWNGTDSGLTKAYDRPGINDRTAEAAGPPGMWNPSDFWAFNSSTNDELYLGDIQPFDFAQVQAFESLHTLRPDPIPLNFTYWNGSSWATLPTTRNSYGTTLSGFALWQPPTDWAPVSVDGRTAYWVRATESATTISPFFIDRTTGIRDFRYPTVAPRGTSHVPVAWEDYDLGAIVAQTYDTLAPVIGIKTPAPAENLREPRPPIELAISDWSGSGIDSSTLAVYVDGSQVSPVWNPETGSLTHTPAQDLAKGEHVVTATVSDAYGNPSGLFSSTFSIIDFATVMERTERTITFANLDGTRSTVSRAGIMHYQESDGSWQRVDARLIPSPSGITNVAGPLNLAFAPLIWNGDLVKVSGSGWSVGFRLEGARFTRLPEFEGPRIRYPEALPATDLDYLLTGNGVKEIITIKEAPSSPPIYRFPITLTGVTAVAEGGTIYFRNSFGEEVAHIPPGVAFDSSADQETLTPPASSPVSIRLITINDNQVIEVQPDANWLNDPARVYPVMVDPSVERRAGAYGQDAFINSVDKNGSYRTECTYYGHATPNSQTFGGGKYINPVAYKDTSSGEYVSVAKFDLSPVHHKKILAASWNGLAYEVSKDLPDNPYDFGEFRIWVAAENRDLCTVHWGGTANDPPNDNDHRPNHNGNGITVRVNDDSWAAGADITTWVDKWSNDGPNHWENYGLVYDMGSVNGGYVEIASEEMSVYKNDSYLSVTWEEFAPEITALSDSPDPVPAGSPVNFSVDWSDPYDSQARAVICKDNSVSIDASGNPSCPGPGGKWEIGSLSASPSTATYTTTFADQGIKHDYWAFACDPKACSTYAVGAFTVTNPPPTISSASDSPDPVREGLPITFSVAWSDPNDTARAVICKTKYANRGQCMPGQLWTRGSFIGTSPATATLETTSSHVGTHTYYAFACDTSYGCSPWLSGTFTVNKVPTVTATAVSPDPVGVSETQTFSVTYSDPGDSVKAVICKTNDANGGNCASDQRWAVGSFGTSSPATVTRTSAQAEVGTNAYYAFACDDDGACSTAKQGQFTVTNNVPTVNSATASPEPVLVKQTQTFSVAWSDPGDTVKAVICKTNALSSGTCSGGEWARSSSLTSSNPATATREPTQDDIGTQNYYAFVCDSLNVCSSTGLLGTFTVNNRQPTIGSATDTPDPIGVSQTHTFNVPWTDPTDEVRAVICETNNANGGSCESGKQWAIGEFTRSSPAQAFRVARQADVGTTKNYYAFACDSENSCSATSSGQFVVSNNPPSISAATDSPDPITAGGTIDFSVSWSDPDDRVRAVICQTNSVSAGTCPGGAWVIGSLFSTSPARASYSTVQANVGMREYFAFACDSRNSCTTARTGQFEVQNAVPGIVSVGDSPDPVLVSDAITFSAEWSDPTDQARMVVCKTERAVLGNCEPNQSWAGSSLSTANPATAMYTAAQADLGTHIYYVFVCDSLNFCDGPVSGTFTVNNRLASIASVSDAPDPVLVGQGVTFTVGWSDPGDTAKPVICRTEAISGGVCSDQQWASGTMSATSPSTATFTPNQALRGTWDYFAFMCDSINVCGGPLAATFTVQNRVPSITAVTDIPEAVLAGDSIRFEVSWFDPTDRNRVWICKTNAVIAPGCPGGAWTSAGLSATNPAIASFLTSQADVGTHDYWAFVRDSAGAFSTSSSGQFTVQNRIPSITGATDDPDPVAAGDILTFTVSWTDPTDSVGALICKTNVVTAGACAGGTWASGVESTSSPSSVSFSPTSADTGVHDYYAFACDSMGACSTSSVHGTLTVEDPPPAPDPSVTAKSDVTGLEEFYPYNDWDLGSGTALLNVSSGNLVVQYRDLEVPGQGLNMGLSRTYNASLADRDGPIGKGWSLGITDAPSSGMGEGASILATDDQLAYEDTDGTLHHFVLIDGSWRSPPGVNLKVVEQNPTTGAFEYDVVRPDGVRYEIRKVGLMHHLTRVADRRGNFLKFSYSAGRLTSVADTLGRTITFTWTDGHISKARFQSGSEYTDVDYEVDQATHQLTSVTEASEDPSSSRTTSFGYVSLGGLNSVTDSRGNVTQFTEVADRLSTVDDREGNTWRVTYDEDCGTGTDVTFVRCIIDPQLEKTMWTVSFRGNLLAYEDEGDLDESGNTRKNVRAFTWNNNRLKCTTDEAGNVKDYDWNENGQLISFRLVGQGEAPFVTNFKYQPDSVWPGVADLTEVVSAAGSTEERTTKVTYEDTTKGLVKSIADPLGNTTTFAYHERGLLKSVTDANVHPTNYDDYDPSGAPRTITLPPPQPGAINKPTQLSYDFLGRLKQKIDREGGVFSYDYDRRGNLLRETDPLGTTLHCYDGNDNEILVVGPGAPSQLCSLDGTDGYSTKKVYDKRDLVTATVTASKGYDGGSGIQIRKTEYRYAFDGELEAVLKPRSFDPLNGVDLGDAAAQKVTYQLYPNNRIQAVIDEEGKQTDIVYTPDGLPRKITDPPSTLGRHFVAYVYNKMGQVREKAESGIASPTTYGYNLHGQLTAESTPAGRTTHYTYDGAGRLIETLNALHLKTIRGYDDVGNLTSLDQPTAVEKRLKMVYTYNARNEIKTERLYCDEPGPSDGCNIPDVKNHWVQYDYDGEGRQKYKWDKFDEATSTRTLRTTEQTWRKDGRIESRDSYFPGAGGNPSPTRRHRTVFGYDGQGNLSTVDTNVNPSTGLKDSALAATYTSQGELKTLNESILPFGGSAVTKASKFTYHPDGLLASRTIDGFKVEYAYQLNGLESSATTPDDGLDGSFGYQYYDNGALRMMTMENGVTVELTYDLANRVTQKKVLKSGDPAPLSIWDLITYDDDGNRLSEVLTQYRPDGTKKEGAGKYRYDNASRLILAKHPLEEATVAYTLDDGGNVISESRWIYTYEANRLIQKTPYPESASDSDLKVTYGYDQLGNRTTETDYMQPDEQDNTNILYDAADHTVQLGFEGGDVVGYRYDGLDRQAARVKTTDGAGPSELTFRAGLSEQAALQTEGSNVKTRYILDSAGEPIAEFDPDPNKTASDLREYYVTDVRGNLTQLIGHNTSDSSRGVRAVFSYDPYGKDKPALTDKTFADSRLRFQLAPLDPVTQKYAIGPRMLDPTTYRFIGIDSVVGAAQGMELQADPLTGNRYLYAGANPVNLVDDGHRPGKKSADWSKRKKVLQKGIRSLEKRVQQHREKIEKEKRKPNPDRGLIRKWEGDIRRLEGEIEKKRHQLRAVQVVVGIVTVGVIIWWAGKLLSPACGPAIVVCLVVL